MYVLQSEIGLVTQDRYPLKAGGCSDRFDKQTNLAFKDTCIHMEHTHTHTHKHTHTHTNTQTHTHTIHMHDDNMYAQI
jgi:hypothetical protein